MVRNWCWMMDWLDGDGVDRKVCEVTVQKVAFVL